MKNQNQLLKELMKLSDNEKAKIADQLLKSLHKPDSEIDELWKDESEKRVAAYKEGRVEALSVEEVISKYKEN